MIDIQVIDNFFTPEIHHKINSLMNRPKWRLCGGNKQNRFWHMDNLQDEEYFSNYLFQIIQSKLNIDTRIVRIYANGQTAGQNGFTHTDSFGDDRITFLYYPNMEWKFNWGGHLTFLDIKSDSENMDDQIRKEIYHATYYPVKITNSVTYVPNRAILFPASIWHYAQPPHRTFDGLRVSLAYKLEII